MADAQANNETLVSIKGVSRQFVEGTLIHRVLCNLSLEIGRGETIALRGRSGSGKSTLLNIISGIDLADSGTVSIDGNDIGAMSEHDRTLFRRQHIGFVYQAFNLVPTLNVLDNVRLVLELNGIAGNESDERAKSLLESVGLVERAASFPDILSGGEQQRVAIARALAHKPTLILADEPTGNLDDQTATTVLELLLGLVRDNGHTLVIATHSATVTANCGRVLQLREGSFLQ